MRTTGRATIEKWVSGSERSQPARSAAHLPAPVVDDWWRIRLPSDPVMRGRTTTLTRREYSVLVGQLPTTSP